MASRSYQRNLGRHFFKGKVNFRPVRLGTNLVSVMWANEASRIWTTTYFRDISVLVHNERRIKCCISFMLNNFLSIYQRPVVVHFEDLSIPRVQKCYFILSYCSQVYMLRLKGFNVCLWFWLVQQDLLTTLIRVCGGNAHDSRGERKRELARVSNSRPPWRLMLSYTDACFFVKCKCKNPNYFWYLVTAWNNCVITLWTGRWVLPCISCTNSSSCYWRQAVWAPHSCHYNVTSKANAKKCLANKKVRILHL